ncbi:MAG: hypothetical protein J6V88_03670 [Kiritimatiellae bacterium]|nr:hypothetical protein [Kiritimatiellia bacterium]
MKNGYAKMIFGAVMVFAASVFAAMPSSEWRAKIGDCAQDVSILKATIVQLSPEDQMAFIAAVNDAISKKPASNEARAAAFYEANRAALFSLAKSNNLGNALAEIFATVPPEYLTVLNERFASEVFKRNPNSPISDSDFERIAASTMAKIVSRSEKTENASVRQTFAVIMFVRASGGSPANLGETLTSMMSDKEAAKTAMNDWVKPALEEGDKKNYNAMLGDAGVPVEDEPDHAVVLRMMPYSNTGDSLLEDLRNLSPSKGVSAAKIGGTLFSSPDSTSLSYGDALGDPLFRVPRGYRGQKIKVWSR